MNEMTRGNLLLAAQTACELAMVLPGRRLWRHRPTITAMAATLFVSGASFGVAGGLALGEHLRLHPMPAPGAVVQTKGPFRLVRHPIYVGLLAASAGVALLRARAGPILALGAMTAVLSTKATCEEQALLARFGAAYREYCSRVARGLPPVPWLK